MRYPSALLLSSLFGIVAAQSVAHELNTLTPLTVFLESDGAIPPVVLIALQREVEAVVEPSGILLNWNSKQAENPQDYAQIAVVRLRGQCDGAPLPVAVPSTLLDPESLGHTHVMGGKVLPFSDVHCDSVRKLIDRELRSASPGLREELLGRAMGRVVAHELYHVLLRTTSHGRDGLARPAQSRSDLLSVRGILAPVDERRLSGRLENVAASAPSR